MAAASPAHALTPTCAPCSLANARLPCTPCRRLRKSAEPSPRGWLKSKPNSRRCESTPTLHIPPCDRGPRATRLRPLALPRLVHLTLRSRPLLPEAPLFGECADGRASGSRSSYRRPPAHQGQCLTPARSWECSCSPTCSGCSTERPPWLARRREGAGRSPSSTHRSHASRPAGLVVHSLHPRDEAPFPEHQRLPH